MCIFTQIENVPHLLIILKNTSNDRNIISQFYLPGGEYDDNISQNDTGYNDLRYTAGYNTYIQPDVNIRVDTMEKVDTVYEGTPVFFYTQVDFDNYIIDKQSEVAPKLIIPWFNNTRDAEDKLGLLNKIHIAFNNTTKTVTGVIDVITKTELKQVDNELQNKLNKYHSVWVNANNFYNWLEKYYNNDGTFKQNGEFKLDYVPPEASPLVFLPLVKIRESKVIPGFNS